MLKTVEHILLIGEGQLPAQTPTLDYRSHLPEYWSFTEKIPKTSVGKMDKKLLRDRNRAGELTIQLVRA